MRIECTYGPTTVDVMGTVYSFTPDDKGRNVAEVFIQRHADIILAVEHYREIKDESKEAEKPTKMDDLADAPDEAEEPDTTEEKSTSRRSSRKR